MTGLVGVVTQEPGFVGLVAALAVLIFLGTSFVLLVVAVGGEGVGVGASDDELDEEQVPISEPPEAAVPLASGPGGGVERRITPAATQLDGSYAAGMASSLRGIAIAVMQRAAPRAGDRILDGATGAIVPASPAILGGLRPIEVDVDRATLAIGRREVGAEIAGAEFGVLPFGANWFQVVVAVHSLQFAADPVGVLAEWRRVASSGARLSLSVPGPRAALGMSRYDHIYRRYGAGAQVHLPTARTLSSWASKAGWQAVETLAVPDTVLRLGGPDAFRTWLRTRPWADPDQALSSELIDALERDLLAALPTGASGQLRVPFGTLYLTARNP